LTSGREDSKPGPTTGEAEEEEEEKKKNFFYIYLSECTMTVIRLLYGVEFSCGKFLRPVYRCSPRHLLAIGLLIEITMPAGASGGNWWYASLESP
jgi:hypothetical protein